MELSADSYASCGYIVRKFCGQTFSARVRVIKDNSCRESPDGVLSMDAGLRHRHPRSPVEHGISGFLSDDPDELRKYAGMLLEDRDLASLYGLSAPRISENRCTCISYQHIDGAVGNKCLLQFVKVLIAVIG